MSIRTLASSVVAAGAALALSAVVVLAPTPAASKASGAVAGFAGDPGSNGGDRACTLCHGTNALNSGEGGVTVEVDPMVEPGATVPITVTVDNQTEPASEGSRRQGFEAVVRDAETGELWGRAVLTDATVTRYAEGDTDEAYVTHTLEGTSKSSWTFAWEPGMERSGTARVYVAGNAADGNGTSSGDHIYTTTSDVVVGPVAAEGGPEAAFAVGAARPNPVRRGAAARLALSLDRPGPVAATLVDGLGRTVRQVAEAERAAGASVLAVSAAGLAPGTYFVVVDGPGGRRTQPLVVIR
ncbi:choice-of-anchor V domain-containing protein [Rubrivirga marina]|uniref:Reelin domain-containing protein n=1 Tax=Rubrivirga marina TaxID=1196024 RepID=A0A271J020_9BACT|nr:choice-of-anchor V domain-containing protein [Rubrivirga marina]PAP76667.1 hypothetical protein BSZ37_09540 [Rubrivirga marina]